MSNTHVVKSGETLSGIAKQYGLADYSGITGYKSGNPNLIYPGESLTIPGATATPVASPAAAVTPTTTPTATPTYASPVSPTARQDFASGLATQLTDASNNWAPKVEAKQNDLINYYKNLEDPTAVYNRLRTEQGLPGQETLVNSLTKDVMKTQDLIDATEPAVNQRVGNFFMTEGDRTALLSRELDPLTKNLNTLLRNKQYEEIGLQGKQNLVTTLLNLTMQGQDRGAKPYQLGIDFTKDERDTALKLLSDTLGMKMSAFNSDTSAQEDAAQATWKAQLDQQNSRQDFADRVALENLSSKNSLGNSIALKDYTAKQDQPKEKAQNLFNQLVGSFSNETELYNYLSSHYQDIVNQGADMDTMWSLWNTLRAKVGGGGKLRAGSGGYLD